MCTTTDWCIERDDFLVDEFRIKNNNDDRHFSSREEERKRNQSSSENWLNIQNKNFACMGRSKPNRAEIKVKVTGMLSSVSHTRLYVHIHSIILNYRHKNLQENRNKRHDNKMRSKYFATEKQIQNKKIHQLEISNFVIDTNEHTHNSYRSHAPYQFYVHSIQVCNFLWRWTTIHQRTILDAYNVWANKVIAEPWCMAYHDIRVCV